MRKIFEFFTTRHVLASLLTVMILLLGINSLLTLQRDRFPNVDWGWVEITTVYPGASPEDVELNVTNKIEDQLKGLTGIEEINSVSVENVSNIWLRIDPDSKDPEKVKSNIRDAVSRITDFPEDVTESPLITEATSASESVIGIGIVGDMPYRELREIAKQLEKKLEAVPGVARLSKLGYRAREIKVQVSPLAMDHYQIALREIIQAIEARNIRLTGGTFESYTSEKNVVTLAQFADPLEVGDVIVRSTFDGPVIKVKDLAVVKDDFEEVKHIAGVAGQRGILFGVYKNEEADIIRTVAAIRKLVQQESRRLGVSPTHYDEEPQGFRRFTAAIRQLVRKKQAVNELPYGKATVYFADDISRSVENSLQIVVKNGLIGLAFVLIVLTIFLNFRTAFWVAMGIPVAIMGTCFLLPSFNSFLDTVTLTVMVVVIGIVVDDGIIISENIAQRRERGEAPVEAAVRGTAEVFFPVLTTVTTTFLAFAPLFFMTGEVGTVVFVVPLTIGIALFFSLVESAFALPAHLTAGMKRATGKRSLGARQWFMVVKALYRKFVLAFLRFRYPLILLFVLVLAGAVWYGFKNLQFVLFPSKGAERFYLHMELPTGSSLAATTNKLEEVERIIAALPQDELDSYFSRIGSTDWGATENSGWIGVNLTPFSERERNADLIIEEIRLRIDEIEGIDKVVFDVDTGGPPVGKPIVLRIIGNTNETRRQLTTEIKEYLAKIDGVKDVDSDDDLGKEQIEIKIDYDRLARLGLTVADVAQNVRIAFDGEVVTDIRDGDEDVDFRVQLTEEARKDLDYLQNLAIPNRQGRLIRLGAVAELVTRPGPLAFRHFDGDRTTTITADVDQDIITSVAATNMVMSQFDLENAWPGLNWLSGGEAEETRASILNLIFSFVLALLGVYFLLVLLFNSFFQPLLVMVAVPFGAIGVIIAFIVHRENPSFLAMMGGIGLTGVVVNDSLVLVNHLNSLRKKKPNTPIREIIAEGTSDRLRAIILTTLTTVSALLPLAYGIGGVDIYMSPMALVMGWGLMFATPLTLVLIPCLYEVANDLAGLLKKEIHH